MSPAAQPSISWRGTGPVAISWPDGEHLSLSSMYLRDHCSCPDCRHPETKQRLLDTFMIPEDIEPGEICQKETGLSISWANDGHESFYTWDWLHARTKSSQFSEKLEYWMSNIAENPPKIEYQNVMNSDEGVKEWTSFIRKWGFCYVDGCPVTEKATQELLERIAFIRHTHYGGFWQFTSDLAMKDSAYTQLALSAHTDTTYFTDPVGLHSFHLLSHTDGGGGASLLVDGFAVAEALRSESPEAFDALCRIKVRWHASGNEGVNIMPDRSFPVLTLEESRPGEEEKVSQIRWNNDDRAAIQADDPREVAEFYAAAKKWVEILRRPASQYWQQLEPGRFLVFDNWRVLHGRSAFTGRRHMCGGYINMDDFISRWKTLNFSKEQIMNSI